MRIGLGKVRSCYFPLAQGVRSFQSSYCLKRYYDYLTYFLAINMEGALVPTT